MKCPKCGADTLFLTDSGGEPEYQESQWVACDNDDLDCDFTDKNDPIKYEEIQPYYGFDIDEFIDFCEGESHE